MNHHSIATRLPGKCAAVTAQLARELEGVEAVAIVLPYPPSLNGIFRQHNGSRLSDKYRLWRDEAGWMLKQQRPPKIPGPVSIAVDLTAPDKRRRDLDNVGFKAVIDLLVKHQIIEADDSRIVREIKARWVQSGEPCSVYVESVQ